MDIDKELEAIFDDPLLKMSKEEESLFNIPQDMRRVIAKKKADYVFLKTIFDSQSNPNDKQTLTEEELREASKKGLIDKHVYAMGGINLDNIRQMRDLGFGGVVICGDLWNRFNIHQEHDYKDLISHFQKLQKAAN